MAVKRSATTPTKGGEALGWAVDPSNPARGEWSQSALAKRLGVKQPSVSAWVRMTTRPEPHYRQAIEHVLGIPVNDWMTEEERAIVSRVVDPDATGPHPAIADSGSHDVASSKLTGS